jgi:hypothetical protein
MHVGFLGFYSSYLFYLYWCLKRDLTSIDFFDMNQKLRFNRICELSINAKLFLYTGTPSIFGALFLPFLNEVPMNGLEFEHEYNKDYVSAMIEHSEKYESWFD